MASSTVAQVSSRKHGTWSSERPTASSRVGTIANSLISSSSESMAIVSPISLTPSKAPPSRSMMQVKRLAWPSSGYVSTTKGREIAARNCGDGALTLRTACAFHLKLAEFAGNRVLYEIVRDLVSRSSLVIAQNREPNCPICPADDHPGILEAIRVGDVERAVAAMDEHLRNVERTLWRHDDGVGYMSARVAGRE